MSQVQERGRRPSNDEAASYFAGYFDLVPDGDIAVVLREQGACVAELLEGVLETAGDADPGIGEGAVEVEEDRR